MELNTVKNNEIKAIIFDLGNVLIKVNFERMLINKVKEQIGNTAYKVMEAAYNDDLFKQFCTGKINPVSFHQKLSARLNLNMSYEVFKRKWCDIFEPIEGMPELLSQLSKNYAIGLLSDTDPIHWQYVLQKYPFLQSIKRPTLSFETGYMKPSPKLYRMAAENINCDIKECLFIDDRFVNVEGAKAIGMKAIQFIDLSQLKNFLKELKLI
jgi:FMN phosphatase YigB (HAD superfamily)